MCIFDRPGHGCTSFRRNFCSKCLFTCYWQDPAPPNAKNTGRFVSLPFPSSYHYWPGITNLPWAVSQSSVLHRNVTAIFLGSTQTLTPPHTRIRKAIVEQCKQQKQYTSTCHYQSITHSSVDSNIADLLEIYKTAIFCLCPPGDDPARKAVFDAILSGCIPVIFEKATLYNQYPWHIGEQAALDISV